MVLVVACAVTAGCAHRAKPRRGVVTVLAQGDVDSLDPGVTYSQFGYLVQEATQRTLLAYRPRRSRPVPDLAVAAPRVSHDGRTVSVRLRRHVYFSPPVDREVTAADVKYALERAFEPSVSNPYVRTYFGRLRGVTAFERRRVAGISGIEVHGRYQLVMRFTAPVGGVVAQALALPVTAPVPREYARRRDAGAHSSYGKAPVATGPFMVAPHGYHPGESITLIRNPNWRRTTDFRRPRLSAIRIREGFDPMVASRKILAGSAMVSGDFLVPPQISKRYVGTGQVVATPGAAVGYIALNTRLTPFDRLAVRRAVAAVLNRRALQTIVGGPVRGAIASHFIPPGMPGFSEAGGWRGPAMPFLRASGGDLRLARTYLRKARVRFGRQRILVVASNDPVASRVAEAISSQIGELGIRSKLRLLAAADVSKLCGPASTDAGICADAGWIGDFNDGQTMLDAPFNGAAIRASGNTNLSLFDDRSVDHAIRAAEVALGVSARAKAWARVDRLITAKVPAVPWLWSNALNVRSSDVYGGVNPASGKWDLSTLGLL